MSFAEDYGHDLGYEFNNGESLENEWQGGFHITKDGKEIELSKMTDSHIINTIKFFHHLNTLPLEEELIKRIYVLQKKN